MARHYAYQARDSVTGDMHYWLSTSATGGGYPGPNAATELVKLADNGDVDPDSGIAANSISGTSPISVNTPNTTLVPKRSGVYSLIWSVQLTVTIANATITVTPRIDGADVSSAARTVFVSSGGVGAVTLVHRAVLTAGSTHGHGVAAAWTGTASVALNSHLLFQEL